METKRSQYNPWAHRLSLGIFKRILIYLNSRKTEIFHSMREHPCSGFCHLTSWSSHTLEFLCVSVSLSNISALSLYSAENKMRSSLGVGIRGEKDVRRRWSTLQYWKRTKLQILSLIGRHCRILMLIAMWIRGFGWLLLAHCCVGTNIEAYDTDKQKSFVFSQLQQDLCTYNIPFQKTWFVN